MQIGAAAAARWHACMIVPIPPGAPHDGDASPPSRARAAEPPPPAPNAVEAVARGDSPRALIAWTNLAVVATALVLWALVLARRVLLLIYVSMLLAMGFSPVVRFLERQRVVSIGARRLPRWAAILIVYLALLGGAAVLLLAVLPTLVVQAQALAQHLPEIVDGAQRWLVAHGVIGQRLTMGQMVRQAPLGSDQLGTVLTTIGGLLGGVLGLVTILIMTFYFLVEADAFFDVFIRLVPCGGRRRVRAVVAEITEKASAWLVGQLILAGTIGVSSAVGLLLLGVPYFYALAVINALGELLPYLGPILAALPAIAVAATVSWKLAVFTALYYFLQQQFESYVLAPRIMEQQVGLSPAMVIVALLVGGSMLGVVGAVLAVPTAAILHVLIGAVVPTPAED